MNMRCHLNNIQYIYVYEEKGVQGNEKTQGDERAISQGINVKIHLPIG